MQQDNSIQKKLQQLDNQQLPDLSQMDKHWEGMQASLQQSPQPTEGLSSIAKFIYGLVGVSVIVTGVLFIQKKEIAQQKLPGVVKSASRENNTITKDTAEAINNASLSQTKNQTAALQSSNTVAPIFIDENRKETAALSDSAGYFYESIPAANGPARELMLADLFRELSKPAQFFSVDNKRDTILICKEGTVILVPAYSFTKEGSIDFQVTEFYQYSDFVLNRLTTLSDRKQLISGGMLKITAENNGNMVDLKKNSKLKVFLPGITGRDSMKIFSAPDVNNRGEQGDTIEAGNFNLNWRLTNISIDSPVQKMFIRAIDLRDNLAEAPVFTYTNRLVAVIPRSVQSEIGKAELKKMMKQKFPYYDKIRIKRLWEKNLLFKKQDMPDYEYGDIVSNSYGIGDTAQLLPRTIKFYKLAPIDTVYRTVNRFRFQNSTKDLFAFDASMSKQIGEKYSIELDRLGWINCDRFNNSPSQRADFFVNLGDSAKNYFTVLVFDRYKSVMNGYATTNNSVFFENLPVGEPVKIISIGINAEGKRVMAMKETMISSKGSEKLEYEEYGTEQMKQSLGILNK